MLSYTKKLLFNAHSSFARLFSVFKIFSNCKRLSTKATIGALEGPSYTHAHNHLPLRSGQLFASLSELVSVVLPNQCRCSLWDIFPISKLERLPRYGLHHFIGGAGVKKMLEFMFADINMFCAGLKLILARALRRGLK